MFIKYVLLKKIEIITKTTKNTKINLKSKKIVLFKGLTNSNSVYVSALSYNMLPMLGSGLHIFKKQFIFKNPYPKPIFYKTGLNLPVVSALNSLIFLNCSKSFQALLSRLFWNLKVTDHRFILLWLRRVYKYIYAHKERFNVNGLSILIKGKLGVTGNKRTRTFKVNYGSNSSTKVISNTCSNYFTIRTTTGVIGFTTSITYNH